MAKKQAYSKAKNVPMHKERHKGFPKVKTERDEDRLFAKLVKAKKGR